MPNATSALGQPMKERATIVIVNYNTRELLRGCLASLRAHAPDYPVVVVDNASVDGSAAMVERDFSHVRVLHNACNVGFGAANNRALAEVTTELTMLLNSDTRIENDVVGALALALDARRDAALVGCRLVRPDGTTQRSARRFPSPWRSLRGALALSDPESGELTEADYVDAAAVLARTAALRAVGGFDERFFLYGEDADLCRRLRDRGWRILREPRAHVVHVGGGSSRAGSWDDDRRRWEALALYVASHFEPPTYAAFVAARALELLRRAITRGVRARLAGDASARRESRTAWRELGWHPGYLPRRRLAGRLRFNPCARLPTGAIDEPAADAVLVGPEVQVLGWALARDAVTAVEVQLDDADWMAAALGFDRPDVSDTFPGVPDADKAGFAAQLARPRSDLTVPFTVRVRCRTRSGAVFVLPARRVLPRPAMYLWENAVASGVSWSRVRAETGWRKGVALARLGWDFARSRRLPRSRRDLRSALNKLHFHVRSRGRFLPPALARARRDTDAYERWRAINDYRREFRPMLEEAIAQMPHHPVISIVMPIYRPDPTLLARALASVREQVYPHWQLCALDDGSGDPELSRLLAGAASDDARVRTTAHRHNRHISAATNSAAALGTGDFLLFLDQDDELASDALFHLATLLVERPDTDVVYSDNDKIDAGGRRFAPQFKPDWNPELLLSYMYFAHFFAVRRALFEEVGGCREGFEGAQDYDLALRLTEHTDRVEHLPLVLYHWRATAGSTARGADAKPYGLEAGRCALDQAMARRGIRARVEWPEFARQVGCGIYRLRFEHDRRDRVSIIIPTRNRRQLLERCIRSIEEKTAFPGYQIVVVDDASDDPGALALLAQIGARHRVLRCDEPRVRFNFSRLINRAVASVDSDYVVFLNNDTEVVSGDWLETLLGYAKMPGVGAVGARLLYGDGRVQHAGVLLGVGRHVAAHAFQGLPEWSGGYSSYARVARNYPAVTAACMLTARERFLGLGGFDEANLHVAYQDVDYCLRLRRAGLRCVYAGAVELVHHEGSSGNPAIDPREAAAMHDRWEREIERGSDYSPNLSRANTQFEIAAALTRPLRLPAPARVALFSNNLEYEGAPVSLLSIARSLRRAQCDTTVFSRYEGPLRERFERCGVKVRVDASLPDGVVQEGKFRDGYAALLETLRAGDFDAVYANTLPLFYAVDAAHALGLPAIWCLHESVDWRQFFQRFDREVARRGLAAFAAADAVVFVAEATRALFEELDPARRFEVIHNGVDVAAIAAYGRANDRREIRTRLGIPPDAWLATVVGTSSPRKGQLDVVRAAAHFLALHPDAPLHVAVVGMRESGRAREYCRQIRKEVAESGHEDRFHLFAETGTPFAHYHASDVFVCASYNESFPLVILEAMAFGLPIVTTSVFGIREAVQDGVTALFFSPGRHESLASALHRLWRDPDLARRLADNARNVARVRFDLGHFEREHMQLFDRFRPRIFLGRERSAAERRLAEPFQRRALSGVG